MKYIVTPEDFDSCWFDERSKAEISEIANTKLKEWLDKNSQTVYICDKNLKTIHFVEPVDATHKGLLICVEELPKKECEHNNAHSLSNKPFYWSCQDCGKMLRIKFEVVE